MTRIDHIRQRLDRWARWATAKAAGGLGYYSASAFTRLTARSTADGGYGPISDAEAEQTQRAVTALLPHHIELWDTLQAYYIKGYDIARVARMLRVADSTIKTRLARADAVLDAWLTAQAEAAQMARRNKAP